MKLNLMKQNPPNLFESLEINDDGSIIFNGRRVLMLDAEFLKRLKQRVLDTHELKEGSRIVWNASYACGFQDALLAKRDLRKKDKRSWFQAGIVKLINRGLASPRLREFREENDEILITAEWSNSWEIEGLIEETAKSCSTVSGYLADSHRQSSINRFCSLNRNARLGATIFVGNRKSG